MRARGLMKIRRRGHWARGQRRSRPKRLGGYGRGAWFADALFRLAGIYGPGAISGVIKSWHGAAHDKAGQVFSRIHVEDIAAILLTLWQNREPDAP